MTKQLNLVYFGSPDFSAQILEKLINGLVPSIKVVAVVSNPDKEIGRKQILTPSPVALLAAEHHLPLFKPVRLDDSNLIHLKLLNPDIFLVAAYGKIIPLSWLETPSISTLNIHFSLLPRYRGALCIQEAIKNEDKETGVTLMEMDQELDHGPIISKATQEIDQNDDVASLTQKLTNKAVNLIKETLPSYIQDPRSTPQDHSKATTTPSYRGHNRQSSFIDWNIIKDATQGINASKTHALIRSLNPDPGAWTNAPTTNKEIEIKILKTTLSDKLQIETVQIPGKAPVSLKQFLAGYKLI